MCLYPLNIKGNIVACGKCFECQEAFSREWAFRICQEASLYKDNSFITLTYNEDNLPQGGILVKRDLQLFVKRLRKFVGDNKIRYFACGEYGKRGERPHYHIIIFNYKFEDMYFFMKDKKNNDLYRSNNLEKLWKLGFSSIGTLTLDSAKYCAKYMQKFLDIKDKPKPFTLMSRKPAIGTGAIDMKNIFNDKIYVNGKYMKLPRAYLNYIKKDALENYLYIKEKRHKNAFREFGVFQPHFERFSCDNIFYEYEKDFVIDYFEYDKYLKNRRKKFLEFQKNFKKKT